jgi:hypothetical protein
LTRVHVLSFLDRETDTAAIRAAVLAEASRHLRDVGTDWERFVATLGPEHDEVLVASVDAALASEHRFRFKRDRWAALERAHPNPAEATQYGFVPSGPTDTLARVDDVAQESSLLAAALREIAAFARTHKSQWVSRFEGAQALLDAGPVPAAVAAPFADSGIGAAALRLMAATLESHVFGGMGSWNDDGPTRADGYSRVSSLLHERLRPGLLAAVNATTAA